MNIRRWNFSSRSVIAQDPSLRIDQIKLPYIALAIMLQQKICNILCRTYNIGEAEAYNIWFKGVTTPSQQIHDIIMSIIHSKPEGLDCIINRNPTISYGSIMHMYCIGINDNSPFVKVPFYSDVDRITLLIAGNFLRILYYNVTGNSKRDSLKNNMFEQSAAKLRIGERSTTRVIVEPRDR